MPTPSNKRKRTLSPSEAHAPPRASKSPTRSKDIYLEDGNIVLVAEDIAFRVHRSQLARHSEVFSDMLSLSVQPSDGESFDGCSVVRLSDAQVDVQALLQAMYDNTQFKSTHVHLLISVLRMSSKYLISPIRLSALGALREFYPTSLSQWDMNFTRHSSSARHASAKVIQLAHEIHADVLLPSAYYLLACNDMDFIFKQTLPLYMLASCCRGRDKLVTRFGSFIQNHIVQAADVRDCEAEACYEVWGHLEKEAHDILRNPLSNSHPDPLTFLLEISLYDACSDCQEEFEDAIQKERRAIWSSLPEFFGFPSWKELIKESR